MKIIDKNSNIINGSRLVANALNQFRMGDVVSCDSELIEFYGDAPPEEKIYVYKIPFDERIHFLYFESLEELLFLKYDPETNYYLPYLARKIESISNIINDIKAIYICWLLGDLKEVTCYT